MIKPVSGRLYYDHTAAFEAKQVVSELVRWYWAGSVSLVGLATKQSLGGGQMKNEIFHELLASVQEMDEIVQGKNTAARVAEFPEPEVKVIREKVGLSQTRFAMLIGVSKRTLEN